METKRQRQVAETVKRHFSTVLQQEGSYIYGSQTLVTVTGVKMSPDLNLAKIYLSVFNRDDKQHVILELNDEINRLKQSLGQRLRKHVRRVPNIALYLDDMVDEMYHVDGLFDRLYRENQMGEEE